MLHVLDILVEYFFLFLTNIAKVLRKIIQAGMEEIKTKTHVAPWGTVVSQHGFNFQHIFRNLGVYKSQGSFPQHLLKETLALCSRDVNVFFKPIVEK